MSLSVTGVFYLIDERWTREVFFAGLAGEPKARKTLLSDMRTWTGLRGKECRELVTENAKIFEVATKAAERGEFAAAGETLASEIFTALAAFAGHARPCFLADGFGFSTLFLAKLDSFQEGLTSASALLPKALAFADVPTSFLRGDGSVGEGSGAYLPAGQVRAYLARLRAELPGFVARLERWHWRPEEPLLALLSALVAAEREGLGVLETESSQAFEGGASKLVTLKRAWEYSAEVWSEVTQVFGERLARHRREPEARQRRAPPAPESHQGWLRDARKLLETLAPAEDRAVVRRWARLWVAALRLGDIALSIQTAERAAGDGRVFNPSRWASAGRLPCDGRRFELADIARGLRRVATPAPLPVGRSIELLAALVAEPRPDATKTVRQSIQPASPLPEPLGWLTRAERPFVGMQIPVLAGTLGSSLDDSVPLPLPGVEPHHVRVERGSGVTVLHASTHGLTVDGSIVSPGEARQLPDKAQVKLGDWLFNYAAKPRPAANVSLERLRRNRPR